MNATTSAGWSMFDIVAAKRQRLAAAVAAESKAIEADSCCKRCRCGMVAPFTMAVDEARADLAQAIESQREFNAAFQR